MSPTIKDLSIRERQRYLERLVGSAITEGASPDAIDAVLVSDGGVIHPDFIRTLACRKKTLPSLGAGELQALGGRDALRARFGLSPIATASEFALNQQGKPDDHNQENIRIALTKLGYAFGYNALACAEYVTQGESVALVDDAIINRAWLAVDTAFGFRPSLPFFQVVVSDFARQNSHHPIRDYLADLPKWDGVRRLDTWLTTYAGAPDTPFVRAAGVLPLIAAVRRVRQPGTKFDELLVLYGDQGKGKSKLIKALCLESAWFTDCLSLGDDAKRVIENTRGVWIAEIGELQGTQREVERIKVFLSRGVDGPVRMAYARIPVRAPRQFISVGTTNEEFFLKDPTGNRRFWPICVGDMKPEQLAADRDQLWAEVVIREATGESIHLPERFWSAASEAQEAHRERHPWEELLEQNIDLSKPVVTAGGTWNAVGLTDASRRDNRSARVINSVMNRWKFIKKKNVRIRQNGSLSKPTLCWVKNPDQTVVDDTDVSGLINAF